MEQEQTLGQESLFCQSCGMPMHDAEILGTEREGNKTKEYCIYCYETGEFKQPDVTIEGMIDLCTGFMVEEGMEEGQARKLLAESLPHLKRWSAGRSTEAM